MAYFLKVYINGHKGWTWTTLGRTYENTTAAKEAGEYMTKDNPHVTDYKVIGVIK